jgi:hypothetical protein
MNNFKTAIRKILKKFGYVLIKESSLYSVISADEPFQRIYKKCKPYTMTSLERMYALYESVRYIVKAEIQGDFIECGVWKGGSTMLISYTLQELGITNRKIYLYDTFEGMAEPTSDDFLVANNSFLASLKWQNLLAKDRNNWAYASLDEVRKNMKATKYPENNFVFVKGKVEDTIPHTLPSSIALLRLDTDWYESTKHELEYLYPLLRNNGVLIIDDYGCWAGAKKAVDEYFFNKAILLNRIDATAWMGVKILA